MKSLLFNWESAKKMWTSLFLSEYFSDALRNTLVIIAPVVLFFYLGNEQAALGIGSSALLISLTDLPGNRRQKFQTAFLSIGLFFCTALIFTHAFISPLYTAAAFLIMTLLYSMLSGVSARAGATGTMAIILSTFLLGLAPAQPLLFSFYILIGACWFHIFSLVQISLWPYRSLKNALQECTRLTADLLRVKAMCYDQNEPLDAAYRQTIALHIQMSQKQDQLRSLLLTDRQAMKSDPRGKLMMARVVNLIELYEQVSAIHYDYEQIRVELGNNGSLSLIVRFINLLADEIEELNSDFNDRFQIFRQQITMRIEAKTRSGVLQQRILTNLDDISRYISRLNSTVPDGADSGLKTDIPDNYHAFIPERRLALREFWGLFLLKSPIFRFSVRLALSFLLAYLLIVLLGHQKYSYWLLLTIVIVARPKFGITWKRNIERLSGTLAGLLLGLILSSLINVTVILLVMSALFLVGFFAFNRINYRISVMCITPAVILTLSVYHGHPGFLIAERLIYTLIGCLIAFVGVYLFPVWERRQLNGYINAAIAANENYLSYVLNSRKAISPMEVKLARKDAHSAIAAFSESLEYMLLEPGKHKINLQSVHLIQTLLFRINSVITSLLLASENDDISLQMDFINKLSNELTAPLSAIHR